MSKTTLHPTLRRKLHTLRVRLRGRLLFEGLAWLLTALGALAVVTFAFDYILRLDPTQRLLILALCSAGVLWTLWRRVLVPQWVGLGDLSLAVLVERHFRQLGDRLVSTLQFADERAVANAGMSPVMMQRVAEETHDIAAPLAFGEVINRRSLWKSLTVAALTVLVLGGSAAARPDLASLWFRRNILLAEVDWPQSTYLRVLYVAPDGTLQPLLDLDGDGEITYVRQRVDVLRGDSLHVLVETLAGTRSPDLVTLHSRYPSEGQVEETLQPIAQQDAKDRFAAGGLQRLPGGECFAKEFQAVHEEFEFYFTGGDDRRDGRYPHRVRLVAPPAMRTLKFIVEYPPYLQTPGREELAPGRGVLPLPLGATVFLQGIANKDLVSGEVLLDGAPLASLEIRPIDDEDGHAPRAVNGQFEVLGENRATARTLKIVLRDRDGYTNKRGETYVLQVVPDMPPTVSLVPRGVRAVVCPTARIPLRAQARDDHGVRDIRVQYSTVRKEPASDGGEPRVIRSEQALVEPGIAIPGPARTELDGEVLLDIEPMQYAPGVELQIEAVAVDLLPESFTGPNRGRSGLLTFHVISREDLLGQLVGKQREVRMEFFQAASRQEASRGKTIQAMAAAAAGATQTISALLAQGRKIQAMVQNETRKAADTLDAVALEMELNRLGKAEDYETIRSNVVLPLRQLVKDMQEVLALFDQAGQSTTPQAELADANQRQEDIARRMESILAAMQKLENRLELSRRLENILKMSVEMDRILKDRVEKSTEDLFDQ